MRNKTQHQLAMAVVARVAQSEGKTWKDWIRDMESTLKIQGSSSKDDSAGADHFARAVQMGQVF